MPQVMNDRRELMFCVNLNTTFFGEQSLNSTGQVLFVVKFLMICQKRDMCMSHCLL